MWNRKQVKDVGRKQFKKNYWPCVAICFLLAFLGCEYSSSAVIIHGYDNNSITPENVIYTTERLTNVQILGGEDNIITTGVETISNMTSYIVKFIGTIKEALSQKYTASFILGLSFIIQLAYVLFLCNPLVVGSRRFFLENAKQTKTKIARCLYPYHSGHFLNIVKTMFLEILYLILWLITIVGFFVKIYEYRMIPYILAETPEKPTKAVFARSKRLMMGHKWELFKFDLSYIGWYLLNIFTFGLSGIFYSNPYKSAATAEIYLKLKENVN